MKFLLIALTATVMGFSVNMNNPAPGTTNNPLALQDTTPKKKYDTLPKKRMDDSLNKYRRDTFNRRDTNGKRLDTSRHNN